MQRYSGRPFPQSRYKPGESPRSVRLLSKAWLDRLPDPVAFGPGSWMHSDHYRYAVDLFNHQYWWEAHEVLEGLWVENGRRTELAIFLQGLIQISAALLKASTGVHTGAARLSRKGLSKLSSQEGIFLGIAVEPFVRSVEHYLTSRSSILPRLVLVGTEPN
jgi:hypothetical protein